MSKIFVYICTLLCVGFTGDGYAATINNSGGDQLCENSVTSLIGKSLEVDNFSYIKNACKRWPKDKSITITAFAYDSGVEYQKSLIVALIDIQKSVVVATYRGVIQQSSGDTVENLEIDTARYDLAPGVRAFGVDVMQSLNIRCAIGRSGPYRTLYVQEGKNIRPILADQPMSRWAYYGETNPCDDKETGHEYAETETFTIGMTKEITNGYYNLVINQTTSFSNSDKTRINKGVRPIKPLPFDVRTRGSTRLPLKKKRGIGKARVVGIIPPTLYKSDISLRPCLGQGASRRAGVGWVRRLDFLSILTHALNRGGRAGWRS